MSPKSILFLKTDFFFQRRTSTNLVRYQNFNNSPVLLLRTQHPLYNGQQILCDDADACIVKINCKWNRNPGSENVSVVRLVMLQLNNQPSCKLCKVLLILNLHTLWGTMWKPQLYWVIESFTIQLCLRSNCSQSIVLHFMRAADNVVQTFISILFKDASPKSAWLLCLYYLPFIDSIFFFSIVYFRNIYHSLENDLYHSSLFNCWDFICLQ